jgi:hypothetical protein
MKRMLVVLLFVGSYALSGQNLKAVAMQSFALDADTFLGYDALGAFYYIKNNVLTKTADDKIWEYKNLQLGKISKVDLRNPLKIVVFFQNFNTIVLLDNQLNETQKINLNDNSIIAIATGLAAGNRLWIYNSLSQKIGLYDYSKNDFQTLTTPFMDNVKYYCSDFNYFQWIDEQGNAYRCDLYGKIDLAGKAPIGEQLQWVSSNVLIYKNDNQLYEYHFKEKKSIPIEIDKKTFKKFSYNDQILSIFTDHGITNYKITLP